MQSLLDGLIKSRRSRGNLRGGDSKLVRDWTG